MREFIPEIEDRNHITNETHSTDDVRTLCGTQIYGMAAGLISLKTIGSGNAIIAAGSNACPDCIRILVDYATGALRRAENYR